MYMNSDGKVIDYFGGRQDLKSKTIKTVGNPNKRFKEDYLRILRAIRFCCQLNFRVTLSTLNAMYDNVGNLNTIPMERIKNELNKSLKSNIWHTMKWIEELSLERLIDLKKLRFELTNKK